MKVHFSASVRNPRRRRQRRGATLVFALFLMTILVGMLAFSVDLGYLAASKSEIRRTADAAALAGCWQVYDSMASSSTSDAISIAARSAAASAAAQNKICNSSPSVSTSAQSTDVQVGYISSLSQTATVDQNSSNPYRAVKVLVKKSASSNGEVPFFFGRIFGQHGHELEAEATAAMALQIKGFQLPSGSTSTLNILPFALDQNTWQVMIGQSGGSSNNSGCGNGNYSSSSVTLTDTYRFTNGGVSSGADGFLEANLFPQGTGSPGNRGTVDIGSSNNSTADLARQIVYGINASDLTLLNKPLSLGTSGTMTLNGDTGISAGVKDELASIIGQTRIIPIFSSVSGNGNNATFSIVAWGGVRLLDVKLTGAMSGKKVVIQPAPVLIRNGIPGDATRTWSNNIYSPTILVQ